MSWCGHEERCSGEGGGGKARGLGARDRAVQLTNGSGETVQGGPVCGGDPGDSEVKLTTGWGGVQGLVQICSQMNCWVVRRIQECNEQMRTQGQRRTHNLSDLR